MSRLQSVALVAALLAVHQPVFAQGKKALPEAAPAAVDVPATFSNDDVKLLKMLGSSFYLNRTYTLYDQHRPGDHVE